MGNARLRFMGFIEDLTARWIRRTAEPTIEALSEADRELLEAAIRKHPVVGPKLVQLHANGDLEYRDHRVPWRDL
jgi:hypothetical protein